MSDLDNSPSPAGRRSVLAMLPLVEESADGECVGLADLRGRLSRGWPRRWTAISLAVRRGGVCCSTLSCRRVGGPECGDRWRGLSGDTLRGRCCERTAPAGACNSSRVHSCAARSGSPSRTTSSQISSACKCSQSPSSTASFRAPRSFRCAAIALQTSSRGLQRLS